MNVKNILTGSIAFALSHFAIADTTIPAQPVTISAAVGNEQTDFFYTENRKGEYVVFSGALPIKKNTVDETRSLFAVRASNGFDTFYTQAVPKISPLTKLSGFKVPIGTRFNDFIFSPLENTFTYREIFNVPTRGLYISTSGAAPKLIHVGPATAPITGVTVRFGDPALGEPSKSEQFRVVFGATFPKKGAEPFQSAGTAPTTKLLTDIDPGKNISSNPEQFTTYQHEAYFVATDATAHTQSVYKVAVNTSHKTPTYSAAEVTPGGLSSAPSQLTGSDSGLFYTATAPNAPHSTLYTLDPTTAQSTPVTNSGDDNFDSTDVFDATQFTPSVDTSDTTMAFSAFDTNTGKTRVGIYYPAIGGSASFVELENHGTTYPTSDPTLITSAGDYAFFSALNNGNGPYLNKVFTGDPEGDELVGAVTSSNIISNVQEMVYAGFNGGLVYFTADAFVDNASQTGILLSCDPFAEPAIAQPVRTVNNHLVQGAHNLRSVTHGNISRLYFTAPVSPTVNSEYSVDAKGNPDNIDHGTKPWVVNAMAE